MSKLLTDRNTPDRSVSDDALASGGPASDGGFEAKWYTPNLGTLWICPFCDGPRKCEQLAGTLKIRCGSCKHEFGEAEWLLVEGDGFTKAGVVYPEQGGGPFDDRAQAWIRNAYREPSGQSELDAVRFTRWNMGVAYRAGYKAALADVPLPSAAPTHGAGSGSEPVAWQYRWIGKTDWMLVTGGPGQVTFLRQESKQHEVRPLYTAPPASVDAVAVVTELCRLVQCLIDNDPSEPIADGGHTVLDLWRHEAKTALRAAQQSGEARS